MKIALLIGILAITTGCASLNDAMTPSLTLARDAFDGATIVRQDPVSASSSMSEAWHIFGMEWSSKSPDQVYVTAGTNGVVNIEGLAFNVDGEVIECQAASSSTEYGTWSSRRFVVSWAAFKKLASGHDVKMKLSQINSYSISSFGKSHEGAVIDKKIPPFIAEVEHLRSDPGD